MAGEPYDQLPGLLQNTRCREKSYQGRDPASVRKLARKYHPDINKASDAEKKFKQINEAYEVLGDAESWQTGLERLRRHYPKEDSNVKKEVS